ncbi:MAG: hypothetical protein ABR887_03895 [Methanoregulaceae archaeon]|jgi:hypothetical protein
MPARLHCDMCGGDAHSFEDWNTRICDIDGVPLTREYLALIKEVGCSYFSGSDIPRKTSKWGCQSKGDWEKHLKKPEEETNDGEGSEP